MVSPVSFSHAGLVLLAGLIALGCAARPTTQGQPAAPVSTTRIATSESSKEGVIGMPSSSGVLPSADGVVGAPQPPGAENRAASTPASATPDAREESAAPRGTVPLVVPGFDPAMVSFPPTVTTPQPVIVVAHGAGDLPSAQCSLWRSIVGDRLVLVCLSGPRTDAKREPRYFPDHRVLERILVATLAALRARYPSAVDATNAVYAGYSQGATMGSLMIGVHAADFPRLALVEGGFDQWTARAAAAFKSSGGRRVLFACGTRRCLEHAATSVRLFLAAGVEARVVSDLSEGHAYGSAMETLLRSAFDWLVADDVRFSPDERRPRLH
jgi:pimeloyl-ACP methyl ester carboxylesterase